MAVSLAGGPGRRILGLAGGPGVGKSTLASELVAAVQRTRPGHAAYVPMDGFHMRHAKLVELGIEHQKGMPHTFEAVAFVEFLRELRGARGKTATGPGYSRKIEDVVDGATVVGGDASLIVVEGNYLLLDDGAWQHVRPLLDLAVFLDLPRALVRERLLRRHAREGLFSSDQICSHVDLVDLPNYDLVKRFGFRADLSVELVTVT